MNMRGECLNYLAAYFETLSIQETTRARKNKP